MINKHIVEKLLCKQSYIDSDSNELMLLQGGSTPPSVAHVPEKYSKISHIISYRYEFCSQGLVSCVLICVITLARVAIKRCGCNMSRYRCEINEKDVIRSSRKLLSAQYERVCMVG